MSWMEKFKTKRKEQQDKPDRKKEKKADRSEKVSDRREFRLEKIRELTAKFYAVAAKRKWLFFIIAASIAAYLIFKGGFG